MYYECSVPGAVEIMSLYTAFEIQFHKNYSFDGESHDFWEIVCVTDGKVGITADNDVYTLESGQMIFHKPMEFHRIRSEGGTTPTVAIFSFSANDMPALKKRVYRMDEENLEIVNSLIGLRSELFGKSPKSGKLDIQPGKELEARMYIKQLEHLVLSVIIKGDTEELKEKSRGAQSYRIIVETMKNNLGKSLSVKDIAEMCNMSVSNVKRVFAKYSGMGVIEYFNRLKVDRAKKLLASGYSIKEAALYLGFENQNYFSTMFKRIDGCSPGKYKG